MSYYVLNTVMPELPESFNGIVVFYPKTENEAARTEQQVLFQRLFENGLSIPVNNVLWLAVDEKSPDLSIRGKEKFNCCLFFGVDPGKAGFRVKLPMNQFAAVSHMQLLLTASPRTLNEKPELKKTLWTALQVLK